MTDQPAWGSLRGPDEPAPTLEEWLNRFRNNAATGADASPRVPLHERAPADRSSVAFPMVQRAKSERRTV